MCDCYWQKCEQCDEMIPVHIADFCTPRENIEVFCGKHIPDKNCFVHTIIEPKGDWEDDFKKGAKFAFRVKDLGEVRGSYMLEEIVEPNTWQDTKVEVLK